MCALSLLLRPVNRVLIAGTARHLSWGREEKRRAPSTGWADTCIHRTAPQRLSPQRAEAAALPEQGKQEAAGAVSVRQRRLTITKDGSLLFETQQVVYV
uniref:Uncharacterized protein n=1 Tax=Sphaerodactylus townsendi TaxID=933632 RepID=A0ACB8FV83_9SAUR